jgi:hypothetical protein
MSLVSKELLKNVVNRFTTNGHSNHSSYLIVKYFIGLNNNNINNYQDEMNKSVKSNSHKGIVYNSKKK